MDKIIRLRITNNQYCQVCDELVLMAADGALNGVPNEDICKTLSEKVGVPISESSMLNAKKYKLLKWRRPSTGKQPSKKVATLMDELEVMNERLDKVETLLYETRAALSMGNPPIHPVQK